MKSKYDWSEAQPLPLVAESLAVPFTTDIGCKSVAINRPIELVNLL